MAELLVLRLIHILGGLFWVGAGLFTTFFLAPALKASGPAVAGPIMANFQKRRMMTVMPIVATLTILSGLRLMWIVSAGDSRWFVRGPGHAYSVSGALAILAFLIGLFVARPAMAKAGRLGQSAASDGASKEMLAGEIAKLQKRAAMSTGIATTFLVLAAAGMAIARYL
ncbi:MAG: hypothetical protein ACREOK_03600 [Gemmatimonadaceae bacterium]